MPEETKEPTIADKCRWVYAHVGRAPAEVENLDEHDRSEVAAIYDAVQDGTLSRLDVAFSVFWSKRAARLEQLKAVDADAEFPADVLPPADNDASDEPPFHDASMDDGLAD